MKPILRHLYFDKDGFTSWGLVEYGKLRQKGIPKEKAIERMIKEDKKTIKTIEKLRKVL